MATPAANDEPRSLSIHPSRARSLAAFESELLGEYNSNRTRPDPPEQPLALSRSFRHGSCPFSLGDPLMRQCNFVNYLLPLPTLLPSYYFIFPFHNHLQAGPFSLLLRIPHNSREPDIPLYRLA